MQIDFHHTVTYLLCRLAGMKSKYAEIVAYASQQVDDANHGHALKFQDGEFFHQTMTAHRGLDTRNLDTNICLEVWMPFHYLPQGKGGGVEAKVAQPLTSTDPFLTAPNSSVVDKLLEDLLESAKNPWGLHRLGIGLHVWADAYAHQGFKGFYDPTNEIKLLIGMEKEWLELLLKRLMGTLSPIGHLHALQNPDIPNNRWVYRGYDGNRVEVDNLTERYLPATHQMYEYLVIYLGKNPYLRSHIPRKRYEHYEGKLIQMLSNTQGNDRQRHHIWLKEIRQNGFGLEDFDQVDQQLDYQPRRWFQAAVEVKKAGFLEQMNQHVYNYSLFTRKPGFVASHWVRFMQAAAEHQYQVLHQILPDAGLILG